MKNVTGKLSVVLKILKIFIPESGDIGRRRKSVKHPSIPQHAVIYVRRMKIWSGDRSQRSENSAPDQVSKFVVGIFFEDMSAGSIRILQENPKLLRIQ